MASGLLARLWGYVPLFGATGAPEKASTPTSKHKHKKSKKKSKKKRRLEEEITSAPKRRKADLPEEEEPQEEDPKELMARLLKTPFFTAIANEELEEEPKTHRNRRKNKDRALRKHLEELQTYNRTVIVSPEHRVKAVRIHPSLSEDEDEDVIHEGSSHSLRHEIIQPASDHDENESPPAVLTRRLGHNPSLADVFGVDGNDTTPKRLLSQSDAPSPPLYIMEEDTTDEEYQHVTDKRNSDAGNRDPDSRVGSIVLIDKSRIEAASFGGEEIHKKHRPLTSRDLESLDDPDALKVLRFQQAARTSSPSASYEEYYTTSFVSMAVQTDKLFTVPDYDKSQVLGQQSNTAATQVSKLLLSPAFKSIKVGEVTLSEPSSAKHNTVHLLPQYRSLG